MRREETYLFDILNAAKTALGYTRGKTFDDFQQDTQCQDAVIRRLEIIGEAARRISPEFRGRHDLPWELMIGMRNFVVHQYDSIDLQIIWDTVLDDLPDLIANIENIFNPPA